jgi:hypothetical protein
MDERIERARLLYECVAFCGDSTGLTAADRELDGVEAAVASAQEASTIAEARLPALTPSRVRPRRREPAYTYIGAMNRQ